MDHSRPLFRLINTVDSKPMCNIKVYQLMYLNREPLVLEATAAPTEPQPLPKTFLTAKFLSVSCFVVRTTEIYFACHNFE